MPNKCKKDELSGTGAVAPVTVPLGQKPNYDALEDEEDDEDNLDEVAENILENIKVLKAYAES